MPVRDGSKVSRRDVQSLRRNPQQQAEVSYAACERDRPPTPDVEVEDDNVKEEDAGARRTECQSMMAARIVVGARREV